MTEPIETEASITDTLDNLSRVAFMRRWYIIGATFVVALGGAGVASYLPSRYTSEATLVVMQQRISQRYVDPASAGTPMDALNSITIDIFSRDRVLAIINEFSLYSEERKRAPVELLLKRLRKDTDVQPVDVGPQGELNAFKVTFTANNPRLARDVTGRLTSLFIQDNLKARGSQATTTARFLEERLAEAKQTLERQEQRIRDFKLNNAGGMPEQEQFNLGIITDLRMQLQSTKANLNRAQLQRVNLETELNATLARLTSDRNTLLARFTAKHPDVLKETERINRIAAVSARLRGGAHADTAPQSQTANQGSPPPATPGASGDDPAITRLQGQVEAYYIEVDNLTREQSRLTEEIVRVQGRLRLSPVTEQQLAAVLREYELHKQNYNDLLTKQMRAQMTSSVEQQQEGQHFRLVDPPTLPVAPSGPKRLLISLGAVGGGLALGIALALLVELRDRSYHSEKELRHEFGVPFVVGVPVLRTAVEQKKIAQWRALQWIAASVMMLCLAVVELYVFSIA